MAGVPVPLTVYESSSSYLSDVNVYGLSFDEIREEEIQEEGQDRKRQRKDNTGAFCDVCFSHNWIALSKNMAFHLCYLCEQYMCDKCFKGHESHSYIELVSEKSERDEQIESFLEGMKNERKRDEMFKTEHVSMVDRVNVKHRLDQEDCYITGLCGLNNTRWVLCDRNNYCIKIFCVGSNILQRCIRFGSNPWDVTEIKIKIEPTVQSVMSTSKISVMNQGEPDMKCVLAVTSPWKRRIFIIDVTQNPCVITKSIETEKQCYSIDFNEFKMFTFCGDGPWFVSVISTDGVTIKTINTDLHVSPWSYPHIAVCPGRFYLTDPDNRTVLCLNDEGKVVSHKTIEGSRPEGISVDPDTNTVYISDWLHYKLYRLDSSLEGLEPLFGLKSVNSDFPLALCYFRDSLSVTARVILMNIL